jgi:hypothetical protein
MDRLIAAAAQRGARVTVEIDPHRGEVHVRLRP